MVVACGGSGGGGGGAPDADVGFNRPKKSLKANMETGSNQWSELGSADLSCLGTPGSDVATTVDITVQTTVADFQSGEANPGIAVTAFDGIDVGNEFGSAVTSDENGSAEIVIPMGHKRIGFKMHDPLANDPSSIAPFDTFLLNQYLDPTTTPQMLSENMGHIQSVSKSTGEALSATVGIIRMSGTGVAAGALRDCSHHEVSNFIVDLSSTSGTATPIDGVESFYFSDVVGLPAHHDQEDSASKDGLFMLIQAPVTTSAFVQAWGYVSDADLAANKLTLVSELEVPVLADTVITGSFDPLRQ
nr:hypothetical protein [Kofleriaceae bacterium]